MKVALLFWRLSPYHHARLSAAGKFVDVAAVEACAVDNIYAWEKLEGEVHYERITLQERHPVGKRERVDFCKRMFYVLDKINPDVVAIPGWSFVDALSGLSWAGSRGKPVLIMSDSTVDDAPRVAWREAIKRQIVSLCSSALVAGTPHAEYIQALGMAPERICSGYDVVDNAYFANQAADARIRMPQLREEYRLPENYFLASNRFVEKKNLFRLIEAFARYRTQCLAPWSLVLLGDGALRESLTAKIHSLNLKDHVHLPGFKQYRDLPKYFGCTKAFIHASTIEQWGLVVNEAMASGLPVLVSSRCGCAADLVKNGVNGFTFDPFDIEAITQGMMKVSAPGFPLMAFGQASQRIIADWGPERFAAGVTSAAEKALEVGPKKPLLVQRLLLRGLILR